MGVLEALRIQPESDEESDAEFNTESGAESDTESGAEFNPNHDPQPGQASDRPKPRGRSTLSEVRKASPRITKRMRDDAQNEVESMLCVVALAWSWQAPPCGDALESAAPDIAERLVKILARNPRWLQRVRDGGLVADIVQLAGALGPVVKVAYAHYTAPREGGSGGQGVEFNPDEFQPYDGNGFSRAG